MSATKCGNSFAIILPTPAPKVEEVIKSDDPETSDLILTEKASTLLRKIRLKEPGWTPTTIKGLWGKAYKMGILNDEQD